MASPQTENGYTKIANELLDAMCRLHLSGNQWKVLHTIIRKTYGWNKKADWISGSQIAKTTSLHRSRVCEALRLLSEKNIIVRNRRHIAIQKDYARWIPPVNVTDMRNNNVTESGNIPETVVTENSNGVTENSNKLLRKSRHTKDKRNYTKDTGTPSQIYRRITEKKPRRAHAERMNDEVTDKSLWFQCVYEWSLRGYNERNVKGMLAWYEKGGPPDAGPGARQEREAEAIQEEAQERDRRKVAEWEAKNL